MEQLTLGSIATEPVLWSLEVTTTEPMCQNCWAPSTRSLCSTVRESLAVRSPRTTQRVAPGHQNQRKAHGVTKTQHSKNNYIKLLKKKMQMETIFVLFAFPFKSSLITIS